MIFVFAETYRWVDSGVLTRPVASEWRVGQRVRDSHHLAMFRPWDNVFRPSAAAFSGGATPHGCRVDE